MLGLHSAYPAVVVHNPVSAAEQDAIHFVTEWCVLREVHFNCLRVKRRTSVNAKPQWCEPNAESMNKTTRSKTILLYRSIAWGFDDENSPKAINLFNRVRPSLFLYHMALPLCDEKVWEYVRRGPSLPDDSQNSDGVVVIVSANDLRAEGVELSHGLS
jgi:hypothetical protein